MNEENYLKFRWFVLVSFVIITAATAMIMITPATLVGEISNTFGISLGESTVLTMMTFNFSMALGAFIGGVFIDKFGVTRIWIFTLTILIVTLLLVPIVGDTAKGLLILRILQGLATGPIMGSVAVICAQWFKQKERTIVAGFQGFAVSLGVSIGLVFAPFLFSNNGNWQASMAWTSSVGILALICALIVFFGPKHIVKIEQSSEDTTSNNGLKLVMKNYLIYVVFLVAAFASWAFQAFNDMAPGFFAVDAPVGLGMGPLKAGATLVGAQYAFMLGSVLCGFFLEKLFKGNTKLFLMSTSLIGALLIFSLNLEFVVSNITVLTILVTLIGFFLSFQIPTIFGFISNRYSDKIAGKLGGIAMGLNGIFASIGIAVGSMALHSTGSYAMTKYILAFVMIVVFAIAYFVRTPERLNTKLDYKTGEANTSIPQK